MNKIKNNILSLLQNDNKDITDTIYFLNIKLKKDNSLNKLQIKNCIMNNEYFSDIKKKARINMDIRTIKRIVLDNNLNDPNKLLAQKNKNNNEFNKKTIL